MTASELKSRRAALGMTQGQLAAALGCSRRTVEAWEVGRNPVPAWAALGLERIKVLDSNTTS